MIYAMIMREEVSTWIEEKSGALYRYRIERR